MNDKLFRKKSMEKISSPEQLTDYIRVSSPGVWMILAAIVILLAGICVWGVFGRMDTKLTVAAVSETNTLVCYVKESDIISVNDGMTVHCGDSDFSVTGISAAPIAVNDSINEYALHVGDLKNGEWVYVVTLDGSLADGVYKADIIIDSVSPMSFVFN